MRWGFYPQHPTDPIRNPISGEFFSTEAVGDPTDALVREAVQNTLDARQRLGPIREQARVRIFLSGDAGALSAAKSSDWLENLWQHVDAPGNGLRDQPKRGDACPFLVYEDFGTMGLTGDPAEHQVIEGQQNNFLNFFRAEGHSDKGEHDRGSWGVGKTVFPRASRISAFFGFSVQADDKRSLLLGRSVLKYHRVGKNSFKSDGYFGKFRASDGFALPLEEPSLLGRFRTDFQVRRQNEPGLSIVVPWYEIDAEDGITRVKVLSAVLRGFFYPILMGHLSVAVETPSGSVTLDANSIASEVAKLEGEAARELSSMLELATWAQTRLEGEFHHLIAPPSEGSQRWSDPLIPLEIVSSIHTAFERREQVALRVHMHVQPRNTSPVSTFFNVFLEHSDLDSNRPTFIRDELIITDVKAPRVSQVRALVIVEDRALANLLRDAETPAHTQWTPTTGNFKNKYKFGAGAIDFVRLSVSEILRIVNQSEQKADPSITVDYFSIAIPPDSDDADAIPARKKKAKEKKGDALPTPVPPLPSRPRRFRIDRMRGGFSIRPGDSPSEVPFNLRIGVAYDIRKGNPLRKYHEADFDLGENPIRFEERGIKVITTQQNRMVVAIEAADFRLDVIGFDPDRDLYVRADVKEADNVD